MSIVLLNAVWNSDLERELRLLALALADIADDDGFSIYPSVARMCWKTKCSERQVRNALRSLETMEILEQVEPARQHTPASYRFHVEKLPTRLPFHMTLRGAENAPLSQGGKNCTSEGQKMPPIHNSTHQQSTHVSSDSSENLPAEPLHSGTDDPTVSQPLCNVSGSMSRARARERKPSEQAARVAFERIWATHPRKVGKEHAWKAWLRIWTTAIWVRGSICEAELNRIVRALEREIPKWRDRVVDGEAHFVPHFATWLNGKRWNDVDDDDATAEAAQEEARMSRPMYPPVKDL